MVGTVDLMSGHLCKLRYSHGNPLPGADSVRMSMTECPFFLPDD
jgi:hypothetical protein